MNSNEISSALLRVVTDSSTALSRGAADRARIAKINEAGGTPTGHRVDWLKETALKLNDTLMDQAFKFNEAYPSDRISVQDLGDALATIMGQLQSLSRKPR